MLWKLGSISPNLKSQVRVHPCSCKSQSLPAPDTHLTNTDSRTPCHTCMTRWVGRGGVGIRCFSNIHLRFTRPSVYKKSRQYVFEKNMVMFKPNSDQFRGIWGPPSEKKMKADTKLTVVMCCQIIAKRHTAPSSGRFRRRPASPLLSWRTLRQLQE